MVLDDLLKIKDKEIAGRKKFCFRVCMAAGCVSANSEAVKQSLESAVKAAGLEQEVEVRGVGCIRLCCQGPLVAVDPSGEVFEKVTPENAPRNATGGFLQIAFDNKWGYSANPARRHNIKTGNNVAVEILAEVDRKIDDGLPASGRFQFSTYAADADAPAWGAGGTHCLTADGPTATWNVGGGQVNCGAATLL